MCRGRKLYHRHCCRPPRPRPRGQWTRAARRSSTCAPGERPDRVPALQLRGRGVPTGRWRRRRPSAFAVGAATHLGRWRHRPPRPSLTEGELEGVAAGHDVWSHGMCRGRKLYHRHCCRPPRPRPRGQWTRAARRSSTCAPGERPDRVPALQLRGRGVPTGRWRRRRPSAFAVGAATHLGRRRHRPRATAPKLPGECRGQALRVADGYGPSARVP